MQNEGAAASGRGAGAGKADLADSFAGDLESAQNDPGVAGRCARTSLCLGAAASQVKGQESQHENTTIPQLAGHVSGVGDRTGQCQFVKVIPGANGSIPNRFEIVPFPAGESPRNPQPEGGGLYATGPINSKITAGGNAIAAIDDEAARRLSRRSIRRGDCTEPPAYESSDISAGAFGRLSHAKPRG